MRKGRCKHYRGLHGCDFMKCARGIDLHKFEGPQGYAGLVLRLPCLNDDDLVERRKETGNEQAECVLYREPTQEEIDAYEAMIEAHCNRMMKCTPLINKIKTEHAGETTSGKDECPVCGKTIYFSHAGSNGHVWLKCETKGCVRIAE